MLNRSGAPIGLRYKAYSACGIAVSCVAAIAILGPPDILASLIFMPLLTLLIIVPSRLQGDLTKTDPKDKRDFIVGCLSRLIGEIGNPNVAMIVEIDNYQKLAEIYGCESLESALSFTQSATEEQLTAADVTIYLDGSRLMSAFAPQAPHEHESMLHTCTRIQHALSNAPTLTDLLVQLTASIGFAASNKLERPTAEGLMQASFSALLEARRKAPSAARAFFETMLSLQAKRKKLPATQSGRLSRAKYLPIFNNNCTSTMERCQSLKRWHHPEQGIISPVEFLLKLEPAGLLQKLGETMIKQALQALTFWNKSGLNVPRIGVNFSTSELRNPRLVDRIAINLDFSNIARHRLVIEILEAVITDGADDDIIGNLAALADLGCGIDLDDFGTGYASITNIRRFSVGRIKIDRSFVAGVDTDSEQRNMVAAILTMADRLGVQTLAEGVETRGEQDALKALGWHNVQGF
jgi:EAL domain-containing protein (putative c-di-GMP-specific phosphodiesterase class I)/GGDEF domain-containing protein